MKKPAFRVLPYTDPRYQFVVRGKVNGKWTRKYFESKAAAVGYANTQNVEMMNKGREGVEFPTSLRVMAQQCEVRLSEHGKTLADATNHYLAFLEATKRSCTATELVTELLQAKLDDGASDRYLGDLKYRLTRFASDFNGQLVATITGAQIDDWLRSLKVAPVTRNNFRRVLIVAFNYGKGRGYTDGKNPADTTAKAKQIKSPVGILTVEETQRLLDAATPETLPYLAIGAFAGLRSAELARLEWRDVDLGSRLIEVTARNAKLSARRLVKIEPNLAAWIGPSYALHGAKGGRVAPTNLRKRVEAVRRSAGLSEWKSNALRHSFGSYHLAKFNNADALALQMGNSREVIMEHYREVVKPKDAKRYWNVKPTTAKTGTKGAKVVPFRAVA